MTPVLIPPKDTAHTPTDPLLTFLGKRFMMVQANGSLATASQFGELVTFHGSPITQTQANSLQPTSLNLETGAINAAVAGVSGDGQHYTARRNAYFKIRFRIMDLTNTIFWAGFTNADVLTMTSDEPAGVYAGIRLSSTLSTAALVSTDGSTVQTVNSGVSFTTDTMSLEVMCKSGICGYRINSQYVGRTTVCPPDSTNMYPFLLLTTLADENKELRFMKMLATCDDEF